MPMFGEIHPNCSIHHYCQKQKPTIITRTNNSVQQQSSMAMGQSTRVHHELLQDTQKPDHKQSRESQSHCGRSIHQSAREHCGIPDILSSGWSHHGVFCCHDLGLVALPSGSFGSLATIHRVLEDFARRSHPWGRLGLWRGQVNLGQGQLCE